MHFNAKQSRLDGTDSSASQARQATRFGENLIVDGNDELRIEQLSILQGNENVSVDFDDFLRCRRNLLLILDGQCRRHSTSGMDLLPLDQLVTIQFFTIRNAHICLPSPNGCRGVS